MCVCVCVSSRSIASNYVCVEGKGIFLSSSHSIVCVFDRGTLYMFNLLAVYSRNSLKLQRKEKKNIKSDDQFEYFFETKFSRVIADRMSVDDDDDT